MKKSDLKLLRERNQKAVMPSPKKDDVSDELSKMFDDGTALEGGKPVNSAAIPVTNNDDIDQTRLNSTQLDSTRLNSTHIKKSTTKRVDKPVAPERDFNRRPNSLERDALPKGLFPGTSKKLYDALYLRTRGAVVPVRSIQATRTEVMRWAGIGGLNTFLSHIKYLTNVGLIVRQFEIGNKDGAIYEVRIPEELNSTQLNSTQLNSTQLDSTPNRVHDSTQKLMRVESSQTVEPITTSEPPKTSFKTKEENTDDDAAHPFIKTLQQAELELTGKVTTNPEKWKDLAELLVTELKIAAGRTTVSNVPAFLAEHLRRRLWKVDKHRASEIAVEPEQGSHTTFSDEERRRCPDCGGTNFWYPQGPD
ncbi:MAG: hypothetical protein LC803_08960, partial [Acidobacteria bacterium]|nr:hypothetical protein [Acidobacteriota bacterium]